MKPLYNKTWLCLSRISRFFGIEKIQPRKARKDREHNNESIYASMSLQVFRGSFFFPPRKELLHQTLFVLFEGLDLLCLYGYEVV